MERTDSCTLHRGYVHDNGYGKLYHKGKRVYAHRLAYCRAHGLTLKDIEGKLVRHTCDVRLCINPEHLLLGTHQDNSDDKVSRGRQARGASLPQTKLTPEQSAEIRKLYVPGSREFGTRGLARKFGVAQATIQRHLAIGE